MAKIQILLSFLTSIIFMSSCMRETSIDLESLKDEPKIVVYGFLTPADSIQIMVTKTIASTDKPVYIEDVLVANAWVEITDMNSQQKVQLSPNSINPLIYGCSQNEMNIEEGGRYQLSIRSSGLPSILAETTVPANRFVWEKTKITETSGNDEQSATFQFRGSWQKQNSTYGAFVSSIAKYTKRTSNDSVYTGTANTYENNFNEVGNYFQFESTPYTIRNQQQPYGWDLKRSFLLITADTHLTQYMMNYLLIKDVDSSISDGSFIGLFQGILPEYSNVENGFGVFGSYLKDEFIAYELQP
jgi:hypothetical protein